MQKNHRYHTICAVSMFFVIYTLSGIQLQPFGKFLYFLQLGFVLVLFAGSRDKPGNLYMGIQLFLLQKINYSVIFIVTSPWDNKSVISCRDKSTCPSLVYDHELEP